MKDGSKIQRYSKFSNIVERFVVGNGKLLAQNSSTQLTLESVLGGGTKTLAGAIVCYHVPQMGGIKLTDEPLTNATVKKYYGKFLKVSETSFKKFLTILPSKPV